MAGQGKTLAVIGGLLALGIGGAVWFAMSAGSSSDATPDAKTVAGDAASDTTKTAAVGPKRPKPKGTAAITGEIRRSKGKVPIADQEVQLLPEKGDAWTVKTDAKGGFKLAEIPHGGPYELRVAAPGCGTIRIPGIALDRNETRNVGTLWLDPSVSVTVQVRAWSDEPVAGALVEAYAIPSMENFDWSKAMAQMNQVPVAVAKATTDAAGEAKFPEIAVGRWTFAATKEGFGRAGRATSLRSDAPPAPVKLYLGTGTPLAGRVFDSAKNPVPGAQVQAGPPGSNWDMTTSALRTRVVADDQGRYSFSSLEQGDVQLFVGRPGGVVMLQATVKIPNVKQFDVYLKGTSTLTGTVTEKDGGKPIEGAVVRAFSSNAPSEATTDATGKYTLAVTAGMVGSISLEKEGWVSAEDPSKTQQQNMMLREGETQTRDLKMRPASKVTGVVKGPDGPLSGVKIFVSSGSQDRGWTNKGATTDADGKYEVASLTPGKAMVQATVAGYYVKDFPENYWMILNSAAASPWKIDLPEGGAATKDIDMVKGIAVEGRVDGPDGPLAGVRVASYQDYEGGVVTGADGAFKIEGMKPAPSTGLYLVKEGYAPAPSNKPITVSADQPTTGVVLKMTRTLVVKGTVTAADGAPIHDGKVSAYAWNDQGGAQQSLFYGGQNTGSPTAPIRPDGTYEAPVTGGGNKLRVTASALERPSVTADPVSVIDGQNEYVVNVNLDAGKDLEGKVVSKQGGAAVAGAMIYLNPRAARGGMAPQFYDGGYFGRGGTQTVWAVTDSEGHFAIGHLASGSYTVSAQADGYVGGSATADLAASNQVTIEMEPELTIEGVVTFADGSPAEGASVQASRDAPAPANAGGATMTRDVRAVSMSPDMMRGGMGGGSTITGTGGVFRLNGLSSGAYRLTVSNNRQNDLNIKTKKTDPIAAGLKDVKIIVDAGGIIAGRVLDPQKQGAPNVWIHANPEPSGGKPVDGAESRSARTREDGTFSIVGLADVTTYALNVQGSQGWDMPGAAAWKNQTIKGISVGAGNLEIVLEEGLSITGVVVDGDGKPVGNSYLYCSTSSSDGKQRSNRNAMTDSNGAFAVGGLEAGDCSFTIQSMGQSGQLVIQNGDKIPAGSKDVRLVATKGLTITGTVVDEAGVAVKGAGVNAQPKGGGNVRGGYATTKDDGSFEVTGLVSGGTYTINVNAQGRARGKSEDIAAGASGVRIVSPKGFEASGRLLDDKGAPVKSGRIIARSTSDSNQVQFATIDGESGSFTLKGLAEGTYEVQAYVNGINGSKKCGTLKAGDTGVDLRMEP